MSNKILVIFAHPLFEKSRVSRTLLRSYPRNENITVNDLYDNYPDFNIDIEHEKSLLTANEIVILHHPLYWYSFPPLLKQWMDMVLQVGWAYGTGGTALAGKSLMQVITAGGSREAYTDSGKNKYALRTFLRPVEQSAVLCGMNYLPPFVVHGTHRLKRDEIESFSVNLKTTIKIISDDSFNSEDVTGFEYFNDFLEERNLV